VPGARLVRLERNYRSHQIILDAANAVIARNRSRLGKRLWSEDRSGGPIAFCIYPGDPSSTQLIINGSVFQGGIELVTGLTDLVINDCYYLNSSGNYVPGIPPVSSNNGSSIFAMSPSTKPITLTSGTSATNPAYLMTGTIRIPVTLSPTSTAAATVSVAITDQYGNATTTTMASAPAGSTAGIVQTITFDIPPQASYTVTATNATLGEGTISYNATAISLKATSVSLS